MTNLRSEDDRCKQLQCCCLCSSISNAVMEQELCQGHSWANAWVKAVPIRQAQGAQGQLLVSLSLGHGLKSSVLRMRCHTARGCHLCLEN